VARQAAGAVSGQASAATWVGRVIDVAPESTVAPGVSKPRRQQGSAGLALARSATSTVAIANESSRQDARAGSQGRATAAPEPGRTILRDATDPAAPEAADEQPATAQEPPRSAGGPAGASGPGPTGTSTGTIAERDLEEMVRRLYPRLRRSLSSELLVARERVGTLVDLR
jgi:hypothetical protein